MTGEIKYKRLFAICFPDKREWLEDTLKKNAVYGISIHMAEGIVKHGFANTLGFNDSYRIVMSAYIESTKVKPLFEILQSELYHEPGSGIAFTVNIDAHTGAKSMILIDEFIRKFEGENHGK